MTRPAPDGSRTVSAVFAVGTAKDGLPPDVLLFGQDLRGAELPARAGQSAHHNSGPSSNNPATATN